MLFYIDFDEVMMYNYIRMVIYSAVSPREVRIMAKYDDIITKYTDGLVLRSEPSRPLWNNDSSLSDSAPLRGHTDSCMITALLMLYDLNGDKRLLDYCIRFTEAYVREDGSIPSMNYADYDLGNITGGRNLFRLWKLTGNQRFRLGFEKLWYEQIVRHPRLTCGNFWHKARYPDQIWLEGAYMVLPFMAEYAKLHSMRGVAEDVQRQFTNLRSIMRDPATGLYYSGYDDTNSMRWADRITGLSSDLALYPNGSLCAALADTCEINPSNDVLRRQLAELLADMSRYVTAEGMLLHQPVRPENKDNFPETGGTLLFAYAAMKAARLDICGDHIRQTGVRAFEAVTDKYADNSGDIPLLGNIAIDCAPSGPADCCVTQKAEKNDVKGLAPYIMAYTELYKK